MPEIATGGEQVVWTAPQCPFTIEYSLRVLDDVRLTVVDAFFSLPRGGAEIGGILLGTHEPGRITITSYQGMDCEHSTGPSFTLSGNDEAKLTELLASARGQVVGWYHSHTRSEIFLSEADLNIHNRFFPEPWQVALVMKPHTFQPMRMGFFFREGDGSVHASAPYQEIVLEPLPMRQVPSGDPRVPPSPVTPFRRETDNRGPIGPIIDIAPALPVHSEPVLPQTEPQPATPPLRPVLVKAPEPLAVVPTPVPVEAAALPAVVPAAVPSAVVPEAAPEAERAMPPPPKFLQTPPQPSRRWLAFLAIAAGLAIGAVAYQTHEVWLPMVSSTAKPATPHATQAAAPPPVSLNTGLNTLDTAGQLQIRWDRNSPPARTGVSGILEIVDGAGGPPQSIPMDPQHIQAGIFTYGRQTDRVEVKLTIRMPDGREARETTSFLGALPQAPPEDPEVRRQRDQLAQEAAKLKADLAAQEKRTKKLEKSLTDVQKTIREQQLKRLENQVPQK